MRRYVEIKQANLPSSVTARKTREFRCPPHEQVSDAVLVFHAENDFISEPELFGISADWIETFDLTRFFVLLLLVVRRNVFFFVVIVENIKTNQLARYRYVEVSGF